MPAVFAPAKINLYLHVTGRRDNGYHLLDSLTVFARDIADRLTFTPAPSFSLNITGPFADASNSGLMEDNLVLRAAKAVARACGRDDGFSITLEKNIPMGAGLGGGSADAAAAVRALEQLWGAELGDAERDALLLKLGADVPVCYRAATSRFEGIGDVVTPVDTALPEFHLLLLCPDAHTVTKDVFGAREKAFGERAADVPRGAGFEDFISWLSLTRNDLEDAAQALTPQIKEALNFLSELSGCRLARMSGSGSCVFGIFESAEACRIAAEDCRKFRPQWWAQATQIL
ncbi:MAG: 4-(cytidine 5'-diphospho)-2-C-methyl-D-erythritol kinase [Micavibrio aeruginosavorus]|uniref:4-diphosphocytidyl-2-C-methyl-D-erythritol kinase n=1 Tax=Micavibrio aeruginosavorus TaxID=349221 RepID=A0A2W5A127_9BACT|nr:MAG: 4-(cytidine 5'-diphospho)-2-C-methyl-D-erythritol kinase [Micavibrio aeruginosavorus]